MKTLLFSLSVFSLSLYGNFSQKFCIKNNDTQESIELIIQKGDIIHCPVDAIVNAANDRLQGGAGVCGAVFNAAGGDKLQAACNRYTVIRDQVRCPVGQARITDSFNLKSVGIKYIIHAVGPDCRFIKDRAQQDQLLEQTYKNSLLLADKNCIKTIAFPFISSAIYAFPKDRASRIALKTTLEYLKNNETSLEAVHFVLFSQEDYDLFCKEVKKHL